MTAQRHPRSIFKRAIESGNRVIEEDKDLTIEEAVLAASALAALGGRGQEEAFSTLSAVAKRATRQMQRRRIAS